MVASTVIAAALLVSGILAAVRDARGPNRLVVPMRLDRAAEAQLFFDRGFGIRAEDCATIVVPGGTWEQVKFPVPRLPLRELRCDPMPGTGAFELKPPWLESASGRVIAKFPPHALSPRHQIGSWTNRDGHVVARAGTEANDPQVTLGLGAPLRVGRPRIPWWEAAALGLGLVLVRYTRRRTEVSAIDVARTFARACASQFAANSAATIWCGVVVVTLVQLRWLWPLHVTLDWPLWDEANYAAWGRQWAEQGGLLGEFHGSPGYVLSYAFITRFASVAGAIFAQHYWVKVASTVLLYLVLARWWRSWLAATAVACAWAATEFQLEFPLLVYHAAWVWFLAAIAAVTAGPAAALACFAVATCFRQEYQFALFAALAWFGWRAFRHRWNWRDWFGWATHKSSIACGVAVLTLAIGFVGAVVLHTKFQATGHRAWFAFQQHYAARAVANNEAAGRNPWTDYPAIVQQAFPGANSLAGAWRANPAAFIRHVAANLRTAGAEVLALWKPHPRLRTACAVLLACALVFLLTANRSVAPVHPPSRGAWACAATGFLVIAPGLVILAKGAYLLPAVPFLVGAAGRAVLALRDIALPSRIHGAPLIVVVAGALAAMSIAASPAVFQPGERPRPVAETARVLNELWPAADKHLLLGVGSSSYAHYIGDSRCAFIEALPEVAGRAATENDAPEKIIAERAPWAVLVTQDWKSSARFEAGLFDRLVTQGWERRVVPAGELYLSPIKNPRR